MVGTPTIAAWIAQLVFWVLIILGIVSDELRKRTVIVFLVLWAVGYFGLPGIAPWTGPLVTLWVGALDVALVFLVFKGDVRLT